MLEPQLITYATAGLAAGVGAATTTVAALRLLPHAKLALKPADARPMRNRRTASAPTGRSARFIPTIRKSQIRAVTRGGLICYDQGYGCGWDATPQTTMLSEDDHLDYAINRVATMLKSMEEPGTIVQIRTSKGPDIGRAIREHQKAIEPGCDQLAKELNSLQNDTYIHGAAQGAYHQSVTSIWARVPSIHPNGLKRLFSKDKQLKKDERDARQKAQSAFEMLERICPLRMRRLQGEELWNALYKGHHEGAKSVPNFNLTSAIRADDLLAGDDLTLTNDRMIIDGTTSASIVTLWLPPHPEISADLARQLERAELSFRHTIIVEFEILHQARAKQILKRKIKQARNSSLTAHGTNAGNHDAAGLIEQLDALLGSVSNNKDKLIATRYTIVVYGPEVTDVNDDLQMERARRVLSSRSDDIVAALRSDTGSLPKREDQCTLEYIYPLTLVGEMRPTVTGREIIEQSRSMAALAHIEAPWAGSPKPHTLLHLARGRLVGLNLWDKSQILSPTALIVGGSGSGKSVLLGELITNILGTLADATVRCIDFDESLGPLVELLGGKHMKFNSPDDEPRPLNIFDFDGLELGLMPDETQLTLVVEDLKILARVGPDDADGENVLTIAVKEVYEDFSHINGRGHAKQEPVLSHITDHLKSRGPNFETPELRAKAGSLAAALEKYRNHAWLDQPTHEYFNDSASRFTVYELNSLDGLPPAVRNSLAFRVAAKVGSTGGVRRKDGLFTPVLIAIDEGHKVKENYPVVFKANESISRRGNKQMVFQIICTQAWSDLSDCPALIKNSSIKFFGKQNDQSDEIAKAVGLSARAEAELHGLISSPGNFSQYLMVIGSGPNQIVETCQLTLASVSLWTRTNNANERNARRRVLALMPEWTLAEAINYLAIRYPRGLEAVGLKQIDESELTGLRRAA